jgi:conjugal transfer/entry exclusion protein
LQARVVGNIPSGQFGHDAARVGQPDIPGQAAQAGNQLLALQSRQLSDIQAELAANGRATACNRRATAATEAESEAQYQHFSQYDAYVPGTVSMFGSSWNLTAMAMTMSASSTVS